MKLVPTPDWFLGKDVLIDLFSFFILIAFFVFCTKSYRLNHKKNSLFLGIGFFLIALAQLSSIITKLVLYYGNAATYNIGKAIVDSQMVSSVDAIYFSGFFTNELLMLLGLFTIYKLPLKKDMRKDFLLMLYLLVISTLLSANFPYLFHLTAFFLIASIIRNYSVVYERNKNKNTKVLIIGFYVLALSQVLFMFSSIGSLFVIADLVELVSYSIFLIVIKGILASHKTINKVPK